MRSTTLQRILALVFIVLGAWCVFLPRTVETLTIRPEHQVLTAASSVFIACFGAQAVLCGALIWFARFTPKTFLAFGLIGSIPFFAFNVYFYFIEPIFTRWMLLDFVGNVVILACGLVGYRLARREGRLHLH
jgi:hypothetical protein